jgi:hypothetical protein
MLVSADRWLGGERMILGILGRLMQLVARLGPAGSREDLRHVGEELVRLDRWRRQPPATSR